MKKNLKYVLLAILLLSLGLNIYNLVNRKTSKTSELPKPELSEGLRGTFGIDKNIFLMCGAGGYAGSTKEMLVALGWDENKIYNIGGYWYYNGNNNVEVKRTTNNKTYYDFYKINYHNIDFTNLTKVSK